MKKIEIIGKRVRVVELPEGVSKTQQQFKDMTDVNKIMAKYKKTQQITHLNMKRGVYADLTGISDYQSSLQKVIDANSAFNLLPSSVRHRFSNDPQMLINFLQDDKNYDEAVKLGLVEKKQEVDSQSAVSKSESESKN